ncbi:MAG: hypothetical protein ABSF10_16230 [Verrucomicrobiota bacterium]|jgi:hypothetical protein
MQAINAATTSDKPAQKVQKKKPRRPIGRPQCGQRFPGDPIFPRQAGHWIVSLVFSGAAGELPLFIRDQANGANRF